MTASIHSITFDCSRPALLARFWAAALGYKVRPYDDEERARLRAMGIDDIEDDPSVAIDPAGGVGPTMFFTKVPEPKAAKNRVHLDLHPGHSMKDEVERLTRLGATIVRAYTEERGEWTVMADPEGNEFCVEER